MIMSKKAIKLLFSTLILLIGCSDLEHDNNKKTQVKNSEKSLNLYPWLEGDWQGELYFHAMEKSFPAKLKYHHGKLKVFFQDYCKGEATFALKQKEKSGLEVICKDGSFNIIPQDSNNNYLEKITDIDSKSQFEIIYIQYHEKDRFAGWLKKEGSSLLTLTQ